MSSYYYLDDPKSKMGSTPVPEEEFIKAVFSIARKHGLDITDEMILKEIDSELKPKRKR